MPPTSPTRRRRSRRDRHRGYDWRAGVDRKHRRGASGYSIHVDGHEVDGHASAGGCASRQHPRLFTGVACNPSAPCSGEGAVVTMRASFCEDCGVDGSHAVNCPRFNRQPTAYDRAQEQLRTELRSYAAACANEVSRQVNGRVDALLNRFEAALRRIEQLERDNAILHDALVARGPCTQPRLDALELEVARLKGPQVERCDHSGIGRPGCEVCDPRDRITLIRSTDANGSPLPDEPPPRPGGSGATLYPPRPDEGT